MTNGSIRDYKRGPKNNIRRWGWNRLLERTAGREKLFPIPYLPGPQDLDRQVATSKGVPPTNLIAIDTYKPNVTRVRRDGGVAICADVGEVLIAWPTNRPVCAVALDFPCGLEPKQMRGVINGLFRPPFTDAAVWINLQRGRDSAGNFIRADLARLFDSHTKNRAKQFFLTVVMLEIADAINDGVELPDDTTAHDVVMWASRHHRPIFKSYKSGVLTFDSVIFSLGLNRICKTISGPQPSKPVQLRVRANLAVRTMREDR